MKILIVGMLDSIHLAKWVSLIDKSNSQILLFPSSNFKPHPRLIHQKVRIAHSNPILRIIGFFLGINAIHSFIKLLNRFFSLLHCDLKKTQINELKKVIDLEKPDILHSMETQKAGYLVLSVKERYFEKKAFPIWLHTNWGSDIYLFGRLDGHKEKIVRILSQCDYYSCESLRDMRLAREYGYHGFEFEPFPNAGGIDFIQIEQINTIKPPSARKKIVVKVYQGWSGRALFALQAIALSGKFLSNFEIIVFSAANSLDVQIAAELLKKEKGINITVLKKEIEYDKLLQLFGEARINIGVSISDGISTSMLEAMAMGAFPIQSDTSTADEWIINGRTGFIVPPEDPVKISECIYQALFDDELIDEAAKINSSIIIEKANSAIITNTFINKQTMI